MPEYIFSYHRPQDVEVNRESAADWMQWFESIRGNVVELGAPVGDTRRLGSAAPGQIVSGFSIISARDLDEAAALADGCPAFKQSGGVEIGELLEVPAVA